MRFSALRCLILLVTLTALLTGCATAPAPIPTVTSSITAPTATVHEPAATAAAAASPTAALPATQAPTTAAEPTLPPASPPAAEPPSTAGSALPLPEGVLARLGVGMANDVAAPADGSRLAVSGGLGVFVYALDGLTPRLDWAAPVEGGIVAVAFSPDGKLVAGTGKGFIHVWDAASGEPVNTLDTTIQNFPYRFNGLAFSPDGKLLAATLLGRDLLLWEHASSQPPQVTDLRPGSGSMYYTMAFAPDGQSVFTSNGYFSTLWRVDAAKAAAEVLWTLPLEGPDRLQVRSASFSADGKRLLTGAEEGVRWLGAATGAITGAPIYELAHNALLLPAGDGLLTASSSKVTLWSADGRLRQAEAPIPYAHKLVPLGQHAALMSNDQAVGLFDPRNPASFTWLEDFFFPREVHFLNDGTLAARSPNHLSLWEPASAQSLTGDPALTNMVFASPDGRLALTKQLASDGGANYQFAERDSGRVIVEWQSPLTTYEPRPFIATFSADGRYAAVLDSELVILDLTAGRVLSTSPQELAHHVYDLAFSPDSKTLSGVSYILKLFHIDLNSGPINEYIYLPFSGYSLTYTPDGNGLLINSGTAAFLVDPTSGEVLRDYRLSGIDGSYFYNLALSPDGKTLATLDTELNTIWLWDVQTGELLGGYTGCANAAAFSPDGATLAAATCQGPVLFYDLTAPFQTDSTGRIVSGNTSGNTRESQSFRLDDYFANADPSQLTIDLAYAPDGSVLYAVDNASVFTIQGDAALAAWGWTSAKHPVFLSPDGTRVVTAVYGFDDAWKVTLWDNQSNEIRALTLPNIDGFPGFAFSPDSKRIVVKTGFDLWRCRRLTAAES